jgi:hypothetical protein
MIPIMETVLASLDKMVTSSIIAIHQRIPYCRKFVGCKDRCIAKEGSISNSEAIYWEEDIIWIEEFESFF